MTYDHVSEWTWLDGYDIWSCVRVDMTRWLWHMIMCQSGHDWMAMTYDHVSEWVTSLLIFQWDNTIKKIWSDRTNWLVLMTVQLLTVWLLTVGLMTVVPLTITCWMFGFWLYDLWLSYHWQSHVDCLAFDCRTNDCRTTDNHPFTTYIYVIVYLLWIS